jgi:hypothetical protein
MREVKALGLQFRVCPLDRLPEIVVAVRGFQPGEWQYAIHVFGVVEMGWCRRIPQGQRSSTKQSDFCRGDQMLVNGPENAQWIAHGFLVEPVRAAAATGFPDLGPVPPPRFD